MMTYTLIGYKANGDVGGSDFYALQINGKIFDYFVSVQAAGCWIESVKAEIFYEKETQVIDTKKEG